MEKAYRAPGVVAGRRYFGKFHRMTPLLLRHTIKDHVTAIYSHRHACNQHLSQRGVATRLYECIYYLTTPFHGFGHSPTQVGMLLKHCFYSLVNCTLSNSSLKYCFPCYTLRSTRDYSLSAAIYCSAECL